jgi:Tol biopolymer transport system component
MNADGSDQQRVYDGAAGGHFLRWTRDGGSVVFRAESGVQTQVLAAPLPGGDYPVWSPDGRWILFARAAPRSGDVWMLEGAQ